MLLTSAVSFCFKAWLVANSKLHILPRIIFPLDRALP